MRIGEKIKQLREDLGYNQEQFSELLEVGQSTISQYETNVRQPSWTVLKKIIIFAKKHKQKFKIEDTCDT